MNKDINSPFIEKHQSCYLTVLDKDKFLEIKTLTNLDSIKREDEEVLVSLKVLKSWIESGYTTDRISHDLWEYLFEIHKVIGWEKEAGYIIFKL